MDQLDECYMTMNLFEVQLKFAAKKYKKIGFLL